VDGETRVDGTIIPVGQTGAEAVPAVPDATSAAAAPAQDTTDEAAPAPVQDTTGAAATSSLQDTNSMVAAAPSAQTNAPPTSPLQPQPNLVVQTGALAEVVDGLRSHAQTLRNQKDTALERGLEVSDSVLRELNDVDLQVRSIDPQSPAASLPALSALAT